MIAFLDQKSYRFLDQKFSKIFENFKISFSFLSDRKTRDAKIRRALANRLGPSLRARASRRPIRSPGPRRFTRRIFSAVRLPPYDGEKFTWWIFVTSLLRRKSRATRVSQSDPPATEENLHRKFSPISRLRRLMYQTGFTLWNPFGIPPTRLETHRLTHRTGFEARSRFSMQVGCNYTLAYIHQTGLGGVESGGAARCEIIVISHPIFVFDSSPSGFHPFITHL